MAIIWDDETAPARVRRILLPAPRPWSPASIGRLYPGARPDRGSPFAGLAAGISCFLSGRPVAFELGSLRLDLCPPFQRRVLLAEVGIPRGRVSTYGRIARRVGRPGAARAVGRALALNPFPIAIPCHRALRSDLSLGGYQGGLPMKRKLLEMEGVAFGPGDRAEAGCIFY